MDAETERRREVEARLKREAAEKGKAVTIIDEDGKPGMKEDVFSLKEGDVVLQYPERLSSASYEDFSAWAQIILRKIKRSVSDNSTEGGGEQIEN
jgi:hypothetical protein